VYRRNGSRLQGESSLPLVTWARFGLWLVLGLAVYFGYSRRHSQLAIAATGA
jgi:APA family basic amino acid/polyamine antiporter